MSYSFQKMYGIPTEQWHIALDACRERLSRQCQHCEQAPEQHVIGKCLYDCGRYTPLGDDAALEHIKHLAETNTHRLWKEVWP